MTSWTSGGRWGSLVCVVSLVCCVGLANAGQTDTPDQPNEPIGWNVLPNGLVVVQYDRSGDGVPDYVTLHQITWSGWTDQDAQGLESQALSEKQWVFIVEYDKDRYVYLAAQQPFLIIADPRQAEQWAAFSVQFHDAQGEGLACRICKP